MKKLTGNQSKLDLNKNGKLDSEDFKMLRGKMANGGDISKRTVVEVGEEEIANIVNKKEKKGFPVYVTTSGYSPQTLNLYPTKEKAMTAAKALAKKNGYELKGGKMANGGSLADTPESFPSNDAISYATGGSTSSFEYTIGGL